MPSTSSPSGDPSTQQRAANENPVIIPGPRHADCAPPRSPPKIGDRSEFLDTLQEHLEGIGNGADIPRILAYIRGDLAGSSIPASLILRAQTVLSASVDASGLSPRRHIAALCLALAGEAGPLVAFHGYRRFNAGWVDDPGTCAPPQRGQVVPAYPSGAVWPFGRCPESGYRRVPTHSPCALLAETMSRAIAGVSRGKEGSSAPVKPPAAATLPWRRVLLQPGGGTYGVDPSIGDDLKPFWLTTDTAQPTEHLAFSDLALDVADVPAEFGFRLQCGRDLEGFEQIVQWAGWLYQNNQDTLAAHAHPIIWAATQSSKIQGVGALMQAIGSAWRRPDRPSYSLLSLGLYAIGSEDRSATAAAIVQLAGNGLLDPVLFAQQLRCDLADNLISAKPVAETLAAASASSPIAGFRILQALEVLLPERGHVARGTDLAHLAVTLATKYGHPREIAPFGGGREPHATTTPGSDTAGVVIAVSTPLSRAAAEQAQWARALRRPRTGYRT